jgi:elongation factor Ts
MAEITATLIKDLRERTGAGMADCKKALQEVDGDMDKAVDFLRKKGLAKAAKKAGREASEGMVTSYIHAGGRIGVLVEINCETVFVARNADFVGFTRDVAMQIAAMNPQVVRKEEVSEETVAKERAHTRGPKEEDERVIHVSSGGDGPKVEMASGGRTYGDSEASASPTPQE